MVFGATSASCSVWWVPRLSWIVVHRPLRMSLSISSSQAHIVLILWYSFPSHLQDTKVDPQCSHQAIFSFTSAPIVCCLIHLDFTAIVTYCWVQGQMLLLWIHGVGISPLNTPLQDSRDDEEGEQLILKRMLMFSQLASSPHPGDVKKFHIWGQIFKMRDNLQRSSPPHRERMWRNDTLGIVVKVLAGRQWLKAGHLWLSSEEFHYPPPQKNHRS